MQHRENVRNSQRWGLFLGLVLLLSACARYDDALPPDVRLADIRFVEGGLLEQRFELQLTIINPNDFSLPIEGLTFLLDVNGNEFVRGQSSESFRVPRLGESRIAIPASTTVWDLVQQMMLMTQGAAFDYRLSGIAIVGGLNGRQIPYEKAGRLSLMKSGPGLDRLVPR